MLFNGAVIKKVLAAEIGFWNTHRAGRTKGKRGKAERGLKVLLALRRKTGDVLPGR